MLVISPQCPAGDNWQNPGMVERLSRLADEVIATYHVDPKQVYLTGFSMGGDGVWALAVAHPEQFRAIAPVASWYSGVDAVCALRAIPVWDFQSDTDEVVAPHFAAALVEQLRQCGGTIKLTRYPAAGHQQSAQITYATDDLYKWFLAQKVQIIEF